MNLLWIQASGCGGCTMSVLNAEKPTLFQALADNNIKLLWHASFTAESDDQDTSLFDIVKDIDQGRTPLDILCIEGSVITGPNGTGAFHMVSGTDIPMKRLLEDLAQRAKYTLAIGSCTAFGGFMLGNANQLEVKGLQYISDQRGGLFGHEYKSGAKLPVINITGCPVHPDWVLHTLSMITEGMFDDSQIDNLQRPKFYTESLVHHGCPRNEYYEYKASASQTAQAGCLMENLGCKATQAHADCNIRLWNGSGSCPKAGYACINCTAPNFEQPGHPFDQTPKIAGVPIGLPTDMPKAWFIALSSLSKAAMPERIKANARSEQVQISPADKNNKNGK